MVPFIKFIHQPESNGRLDKFERMLQDNVKFELIRIYAQFTDFQKAVFLARQSIGIEYCQLVEFNISYTNYWEWLKTQVETLYTKYTYQPETAESIVIKKLVYQTKMVLENKYLLVDVDFLCHFISNGCEDIPCRIKQEAILPFLYFKREFRDEIKFGTANMLIPVFGDVTKLYYTGQLHFTLDPKYTEYSTPLMRYVAHFTIPSGRVTDLLGIMSAFATGCEQIFDIDRSGKISNQPDPTLVALMFIRYLIFDDSRKTNYYLGEGTRHHISQTQLIVDLLRYINRKLSDGSIQVEASPTFMNFLLYVNNDSNRYLIEPILAAFRKSNPDTVSLTFPIETKQVSSSESLAGKSDIGLDVGLFPLLAGEGLQRNQLLPTIKMGLFDDVAGTSKKSKSDGDDDSGTDDEENKDDQKKSEDSESEDGSDDSSTGDDSSEDPGADSEGDSHTQTTDTESEIDGVPLVLAKKPTLDSVLFRDTVASLIDQVFKDYANDYKPEELELLRKLRRSWLYLLDLDTVSQILRKVFAGKKQVVPVYKSL